MNINTPSEMIETVKSIRTCPPADKRSGKNWDLHVKTCDMCREAANEPWEELAGHLKQFFNSTPEKENPSEGELWQLDTEKGRWVNDCYLTPPAVFVSKICGRSAECYVVYPDTEPAGPGDIILDEDDTGFCDVLVETWNRILVKTRDLRVKLGAVSSDVLEDIQKHAADPRYIPHWAMIPLSIKHPDDVRNAFRKIERRVAAGFSVKPLDILFERAALFYEKMKKILPETLSEVSGQDVTDSILAFRFPDHMIPAHAQSANKNIPAQWRTMIMRDEALVDYFPSNAEIESDETLGGRRVITGQSHAPLNAGIFRLVACLSSSSGMVAADVSDLDDDGFFSVEFDVDGFEDSKNVQPVFCAIYELNV